MHWLSNFSKSYLLFCYCLKQLKIGIIEIPIKNKSTALFDFDGINFFYILSSITII